MITPQIRKVQWAMGIKYGWKLLRGSNPCWTNQKPSTSVSFSFFFLFFFFFLVFLGPHPRHMEVPRLGGLIGAVAADLHHSHSISNNKFSFPLFLSSKAWPEYNCSSFFSFFTLIFPDLIFCSFDLDCHTHFLKLQFHCGYSSWSRAIRGFVFLLTY